VVSRHEELAIAFQASQDSVVRRAIRVRGGDDQRTLACRLEKTEQGLERDDDPDINENQERDSLGGLRFVKSHAVS